MLLKQRILMNLEAPKRRNEEEGGARPPKKGRKKNVVSVFLSETEDLLAVCEDVTKDARKVISQVHQKLQITSCSRPESSEFLQDLKKKSSNLKEQKLNEKMYIGLFGRTGAGKSSLINAIVNESQILPSGTLHACTSVFVYVQANTESDKYRADIEFISKEDWEADLHFLVKILSNEQDERPNSASEHDEMQEMAEEKIKAIYGEEGPKQSYDQLVGNRQFPQIPENCRRTFTFDTAVELSQNIGCYIRSDKKTKQQYWPLVKRVTISLPRSPALLDGIVLVDLPGAGDANTQRDEMWKECLSQCASVWIVNDIDRALSDKEAQKIFEESLRNIAGGGECHNITFICTKTDNISAEEIKSDYEVNDQDLGLSEPEDSPDYERKERQACILYRNAKAKDELEKSHKAKVQKCLFGEGDEEISDSFFHVFTVSSSEYRKIKQRKSSVLDGNETELPLLIEHIKKLWVSHSEKEVKDYVSEISGLLSYLHLAKNPCNDKMNSFNENEFKRLEKDLLKTYETLEGFLTGVHSDLRENLQSGAKAAEKKSWENAKEKVLEPKDKDFRGYHKTLMALCKNNGYFRSRNGDIVDLNYTLSEPIYANMNKTNLFKGTFSPRGRKSLNGNFRSFQANFISSNQLKTYRMEQEKYLRLVCIKIKQRQLLRHLEKGTLHRKKRIYNSLSDSIKKTMQPTYSACAGTTRYKVKQIQKELYDKISSSKDTMFQEAMNDMLRQFDDLKNWILRELKANMLTEMKVALNQIPDDFVDLPDVDEELESMKTHCEDLDLKIFV